MSCLFTFCMKSWRNIPCLQKKSIRIQLNESEFMEYRKRRNAFNFLANFLDTWSIFFMTFSIERANWILIQRFFETFYHHKKTFWKVKSWVAERTFWHNSKCCWRKYEEIFTRFPSRNGKQSFVLVFTKS